LLLNSQAVRLFTDDDIRLVPIKPEWTIESVRPDNMQIGLRDAPAEEREPAGRDRDEDGGGEEEEPRRWFARRRRTDDDVEGADESAPGEPIAPAEPEVATAVTWQTSSAWPLDTTEATTEHSGERAEDDTEESTVDDEHVGTEYDEDHEWTAAELAEAGWTTEDLTGAGWTEDQLAEIGWFDHLAALASDAAPAAVEPVVAEPEDAESADEPEQSAAVAEQPADEDASAEETEVARAGEQPVEPAHVATVPDTDAEAAPTTVNGRPRANRNGARNNSSTTCSDRTQNSMGA